MGEKRHDDDPLVGRYDYTNIPSENKGRTAKRSFLYSAEVKKQHRVQFYTAIGMAFLGLLQELQSLMQ
uniref:Uncharacterized protein n=1 Tax=Salix viminalis TaxID=40686 RepID=A0A6N2N4U4_SALVM